jgi:hypothetical protein
MVAVCLGVPAAARASDGEGKKCVWIGGKTDAAGKKASVVFDLDANWKDGKAPGKSDEAVFNADGGDCEISKAVEIRALHVEKSYKGRILQKAAVQASGGVKKEGGTWEVQDGVAFPGNPLETRTFGKVSQNYLSLVNGFTVLNPFKITDTDPTAAKSFQVDSPGQTDVRYFLELEFSRRSAWVRDSDSVKAGFNFMPDEVLFTLGIVAGGDKEASGSALLSAGETFGEMAVGWNLFGRHWEEEGTMYTVNLEFHGGGVSDRGSERLHTFLMGGITTAWSIPFDTKEKEDFVFVLGGVYFARIDTPRFDETLDNGTVLQDNGFPEFEHRSALVLRGEINVPISGVGSIFLAGNFCKVDAGDFTVDPWDFTIGLTLPLSKILGIISPEKAGKAE